MASMPIQARKQSSSKTKLSRLYNPLPCRWKTGSANSRQFGAISNSKSEPGRHPFFSEFQVTNPESRALPRPHSRQEPGDNFCTCGDFATNSLGTCKHIEFTLGWHGEQARAAKRPSDDGFQRRTAK